MLRKKPVKRKVVKRKNPRNVKLKLKDLLGDKVTIYHEYGMYYGILNRGESGLLVDKESGYSISVGRPGYPEGIGFVNINDNDVKQIIDDNGRIEIYLK